MNKTAKYYTITAWVQFSLTVHKRVITVKINRKMFNKNKSLINILILKYIQNKILKMFKCLKDLETLRCTGVKT
jgi:hypothetical protein